VQLVEWLPLDQVWKQITESSICVIPHRKNPHTDTTVPHKLFQYMLAGRPVIVSDCAPLERIVSDAQCGLIFRSGDSADLADKVRQLHSDIGACQALGERGAAAASGPY
jgi:glycosyltransferase involved in cell wall biosynthesis